MLLLEFHLGWQMFNCDPLPRLLLVSACRARVEALTCNGDNLPIRRYGDDSPRVRKGHRTRLASSLWLLAEMGYDERGQGRSEAPGSSRGPLRGPARKY